MNVLKSLTISPQESNFLKKTLSLLEEQGVLIIENFLNKEDLEKLIPEYEEILRINNSYIKDLEYPQGVAKKIEFQKISTSHFPNTHHVFDQKFMHEVADSYLGKNNFFNHEIYVAKDQHDKHNALNELHYDKLSTLKFFLYLNDIDYSNGAFEAVPGSHKKARNIMEYHRKRGHKISRLPNRELPNNLAKAIPMEAKAGSLIVFTTDTYHRAGRVEEGKFRMIMRGHCRQNPMPRYNPRIFSQQWFRESLLNPYKYFYTLKDLVN